jgi:tetratricopeptide (TPR) repeat protein
MDETPAGGRKGEILRPKSFGGSASAPPGFASSAAGAPPAALLPPDAAEALYYEGMAAYQHRHWREAHERFSRLKELQPSRPGLDALIEEVRWFLQLEAAAPVGRDFTEGNARRSMTRADLPRLSPLHRALLIVLAILAVGATLLVAFQTRLPWSWLPWRTAASQEIEQLYSEGEGRLAVGDYEGAEAAFQKILEIAPGNSEATRGITRAQRQQLLAQGYAAAGAAIAEEDWERAAIELANILAVDEDYADAEARAEFVAQRQRLESLYEDGSRLYDLGQWQEALGQFEKVRRLDPGYRAEAVNEFLFVSYLNAAESLLVARGDDRSAVEQAVGYQEKALGIHPRNRIASESYRLSRLYLDGMQSMAQGDLGRARTQIVALLAEAPDYAEGAALRRLYELTVAEGEEALSAGDVPAALEAFDRALGLGVRDPSAANRGKQIALAATPTPTPSPTGTSSPTPAPTPWAVVPEGPVSVRSGPDRTYPVVGQLPPGAEITVTGRRPDGLWLKICCVNGQEVWVAAPLLEVRGALALAPEIVPPTPTPRPAATAAPTRVRPSATPQLFACVSGNVRNVAGGDGLQGWTVNVQEPSGAVRTLKTNRSGFYRFNDLGLGAYIVSVTMQDGWRAISPQTVTVEVGASETCVGVDFWNEPGPAPTPIR